MNTDKTDFQRLLDKAIQPTEPTGGKTQVQGKSAGYTDKRTRPSNSGGTSVKQSGKSRPKSA